MADLNLSHNPKITVLNYLIMPIDYQLLMIFTMDGDFRVYGGGWDYTRWSAVLRLLSGYCGSGSYCYIWCRWGVFRLYRLDRLVAVSIIAHFCNLHFSDFMDAVTIVAVIINRSESRKQSKKRSDSCSRPVHWYQSCQGYRDKSYVHFPIQELVD